MSTTQNQNMCNGGYAHPEALVDTDWAAEHLNDPNVRIIESNESRSWPAKQQNYPGQVIGFISRSEKENL